MNTSEPAVIPEGKNLPEPKSAPRKFGTLNNLAENKELSDKVVAWLGTQLERFRGQDQRKHFCDEGGVMDVADRMARVALRRDTTSDQYQPTLSNVACTAFFKGIRAMTAGERSVFFQGTQLPGRYEPLLASYEAMTDDSRAVCEQRNMWAEYIWEHDARRQKVGDILYFNNKYGQQLVSEEWVYEERTVTERTRNKDGSFAFKTSKRITKDWPTVLRHDLKNCYFDAQIDDMQLQRCILREDPVAYETLLGEYLGGRIKNLDKVTASHMYVKDHNEEAHDARSKNAGENATQTKTGLLKQWTCWARLPIQEKDGKGTWDETKVSSLYWCTYIGENLSSGIPVRILKNPYHHGRNPYLLLHAYPDDKGAYHVSPCETVLSLYWQAVTNWNQAHDNITLRTRAPMVTDGPVRTRDLMYKANKLIEIGRGVKFEPVKVPMTTEITMSVAQALEQDIYATLGTDKPILGMPMLGRTSASEAANVYEQARVPLLEKADDNGQQLFQWMFEMDAALSEQYVDPDLCVSLTKSDVLKEFKPSEIYGPFKVAVVAVTEFETKTEKRRSLNSFMQSGAWDKLAPSMGKQGEHVAARIMWSEFGFPKLNEVFPPNGDYDAIRVAINESDSMLNYGQYEEVEQQENHRAHLFVHEQAQGEYDYLPDVDQDQENVRRHRGHIQKHKAFMEQQQNMMAPQQQIGPGQPQEQAPEMQEGLPGELNANPIEAQAGAEANL